MTNKMTYTERQAVLSLSLIMSLRMIGLFMVLPILSFYAQRLSGATPLLIGFAIGIYGLSQAVFQIPFGALSDRFGRKPLILIGLIIFIIGSLLAGFATSIYTMMIGRALQGIGAVGSTILAYLADLTRETQRTKSMAIAGISIGLSFSIAMVLGPFLAQWLSVSGLFYLASLAGFIGIILLYTMVPDAHETRASIINNPVTPPYFKDLLLHPTLASLNIGIFILHSIFTASFIIIPLSLLQSSHLAINHQWKLFLPALLTALLFSLSCIGIAERKNQIKPFFLLGIFLLFLSQLLFWLTSALLSVTGLALCLFFAGFTLLEAFLPSLISRTAPPAHKGSAMGLYSCSQFSGIFVGGALGGWLYGQFSFSGIYAFCITLTLAWLVLACFTSLPSKPSSHRGLTQ